MSALRLEKNRVLLRFPKISTFTESLHTKYFCQDRRHLFFLTVLSLPSVSLVNLPMSGSRLIVPMNSLVKETP